ncbi:chaperone NapD [Ottowia sp.]|uniref:chaperone NapD n=1 Tax=Ottowia sp. TaxID=1898956 RepID=UPI003A88D8C1
MSVLGVVLRTHPKNLHQLKQRLAYTPGVDLGPDNGDGRLVAVIESTADTPAAATMTELARWDEVLNLSLVFEHAEPGAVEPPADFDYRAWRGHAGEFARRQAQESSCSPSPASTSATSGAGAAR